MIRRRLGWDGSKDGPGGAVGGRIIHILDFIGAIGIGIKMEQHGARKVGGKLNPIELRHSGSMTGKEDRRQGKANQPEAVPRGNTRSPVGKLLASPPARFEFRCPAQTVVALDRSHRLLGAARRYHLINETDEKTQGSRKICFTPLKDAIPRVEVEI